MSISLMDYRDTTGFYGYRVYMSKKPYFCIQKYFSLKKNGKIVSKTVQKAIYQQAVDFEKDIRAQHQAVHQGSVFKKNPRARLTTERLVQSPSRIAGLNFNITSVRPEHTQYLDWEAVGKGKNYDIHFHTYAPFICVWRGDKDTKSFRFKICNKMDYFDGYKAAVKIYSETYEVTPEELDLMYDYQPPWNKFRDFILAEAMRIYGVKPMGKTKV